MAEKDVLNTIIAEALGDGDEGMIAVAYVIANRAAKKGITPEQVVREKGQFEGFSNPGSSVKKSQQDPAVVERVKRIWDGVVTGSIADPTNGGTMFHASSMTPKWASAENRNGKTRIGGQIFYLGDAKPNTALAAIEAVSPTVPARRPESASAYAPTPGEKQQLVPLASNPKKMVEVGSVHRSAGYDFVVTVKDGKGVLVQQKPGIVDEADGVRPDGTKSPSIVGGMVRAEAQRRMKAEADATAKAVAAAAPRLAQDAAASAGAAVDGVTKLFGDVFGGGKPAAKNSSGSPTERGEKSKKQGPAEQLVPGESTTGYPHNAYMVGSNGNTDGAVTFMIPLKGFDVNNDATWEANQIKVTVPKGADPAAAITKAFAAAGSKAATAEQATAELARGGRPSVSVQWNGYDDGLKPEVVEVLNKAQALLDFPISLSSGARDKKRNAIAGGAKYSEHLDGNAADISLKGLSETQRTQLVRALAQSGGRRLGAYSGNTGLHLDMSTKFKPQDGYSVYAMFDKSRNNMGKAPKWYIAGLTGGPIAPSAPQPLTITKAIQDKRATATVLTAGSKLAATPAAATAMSARDAAIAARRAKAASGGKSLEDRDYVPPNPFRAVTDPAEQKAMMERIRANRGESVPALGKTVAQIGQEADNARLNGYRSVQEMGPSSKGAKPNAVATPVVVKKPGAVKTTAPDQQPIPKGVVPQVIVGGSMQTKPTSANANLNSARTEQAAQRGGSALTKPKDPVTGLTLPVAPGSPIALAADAKAGRLAAGAAAAAKATAMQVRQQRADAQVAAIAEAKRVQAQQQAVQRAAQARQQAAAAAAARVAAMARLSPAGVAASTPGINHNFGTVSHAGERTDVFGNDQAFNTRSQQTSDRWNTGY